MLPDFRCTHALLLQGPAGPFFARFAQELRQNGVEVHKVNLHAGDVLFYRSADALAYRGTLAGWKAWIEEQMERLGVDAIFLFGDCRAYHQAAIEVAESKGIGVWVFEEGYLRPDWITLEEGGVNGRSRMPRDASVFRDAFRAAGEPAFPQPIPVGQTFGLGAWYSTLNAIAFTFFNGGFRGYEHHRPLNAWMHAYHWVLGGVRKLRFQHVERHMLADIIARWDGRYFFMPLQVHCDFQIVHSPYDDFLECVHEVVEAFAKHAPRDHALVLKHHPMDRPFREYTGLMRELREKHGLGERLIYVHDLHLPTLLKHATGTVTMNSTVGLSSIHHGTPVKLMGRAIYDIEGLTSRLPLEDFFHRPGGVDKSTYDAFRYWLVQMNQANGNLFKKIDPASPTGVRWFPGNTKKKAS